MNQDFKNLMQERKFLAEEAVTNAAKALRVALEHFNTAAKIHSNPHSICYKERDKAEALATKLEDTLLGYNSEDPNEVARCEQLIFQYSEEYRKDISYFMNIGKTLIEPAIDSTLNLKIG